MLMDHPIFNLEQAAMERWRNGDPMGFVEISAENICYVDPGQTKPIIGLEDYLPFMKSLAGQIHYQRSEFIAPRVVEAGEAVLLTYNYRSTVLSPEGVPVSQTPWNCTVVYYQEKIVHNHWSFIRHRVPEVVEVPVTVRPGSLKYEGVLGELMLLESAAMERWRKGDPWGFIELSAPDVTYFDTGTPQRINGRDVLAAEYKLREGKIFYDVMDFIDPCVQAYGDLAVLFYRFFSTRLDPDGSVAFRTPWNCSEIFVRMDGSWKIIHTHWSHIRGERY
jgi:ketosteroid isomerase-like protein